MKLTTPHFVVVAMVLVCSTVAHGFWTYRWSALIGQAFDKEILATIDPRIGDWEGSEVTVTEEEGQIPYSMARRFTNQHLGKTIVVSLISGVPGKIATHTPDVCYPGSGYKQKIDTKKIEIPYGEGKVASCFLSEFEKKNATGMEKLRVRWMWMRPSGDWEAPDYPRWTYASTPTLHKLYIVYAINEDDMTDESNFHEFAGDLMERLAFRIKQ